MIITNARKVRNSDPASFAWSTIRKYQNVDLTTEAVEGVQRVDARWRKNVEKQAQQIRYCLVQAREYFTAATSVSLATKPNLLYYGTMSLALAEILYKQSGDSSLDRARAEHRHHGLTMSVGGSPKNASLSRAASMLVAHPIEKDGARRGTFELWHRSSRESPIAASVTNMLETGGSTSGFEVIYGAFDTPYPQFPVDGMTLADCLCGIPHLVEHIRSLGLKSCFTRGTAEMKVRHGNDWTRTHVITFHPSEFNETVLSGIHVNANHVNRIEIMQISTGIRIELTSDWVNGVVGMPLPPVSCITPNEWRMWINKPCLNEFGHFYVALYLAGNYARYYPDKWLVDVENSSPLAIAIEELCSLAEWRVPWLTMCELERILYVNEA